MVYEKTVQRFLAKVDKNGPNGCHVWVASCFKTGYGQFRYDGTNGYAHRFSWIMVNGHIPPGMQLDHRVCRNKRCVNINHLVLCTPKENSLQPDAGPGINKSKTHCKQGHVFAGENLITRPDGSRQCKTCRDLWNHKMPRRTPKQLERRRQTDKIARMTKRIKSRLVREDAEIER